MNEFVVFTGMKQDDVTLNVTDHLAKSHQPFMKVVLWTYRIIR
jgi:hypothetical protein